jgi:hypothetical protein
MKNKRMTMGEWMGHRFGNSGDLTAWAGTVYHADKLVRSLSTHKDGMLIVRYADGTTSDPLPFSTEIGVRVWSADDMSRTYTQDMFEDFALKLCLVGGRRLYDSIDHPPAKSKARLTYAGKDGKKIVRWVPLETDVYIVPNP